ncbi:transglycosylase domain-containing protein [Changpingibacter yushuensis]|uniref:transglycosylase domain-containing protein n=1 Tax=Changpingibacter yushuensis TaxID=2758440 RepID=UPI0015F3BAAF|nr:transglycosylase domain-containing protein [Changpingibacter yushuensis]
MSSSSQHGATARQIMTLVAALVAVCMVGGALLAGLALPAVTAAGTTVNAGTNIFEEVPSDLGFTEPSEQSVILAADGTEIASFYAENRIVVASDHISQYMKDAVVAIEDRRFYEHNGIDVQGLLGAVLNNVTGGNLAGGSTITQQYVKNALIEEGRIEDDDELIDQATERTLGRKINEARYALAIEKTMTKDEILTGYLNLAQFGTSSYGVEAAAQRYFSKSAADLTVAEAATLAGITQSPARWDPIRHPEDATYRRNVVLGEMLSNGYITQDEYDEAYNTTMEDMLNVSETTNGCAAAGTAAYFCEYVVKAILNDDTWGEDRADRTQRLYRGGLTIQTTLDTAKQASAYQSLTASVPVNDESGTQMAMSSVEPGTGHILAMAQNTNYGTASDSDPTATQINLNVEEAMGGGTGFQSGSTFKVFTLIEWLKQGHTAYETINSSNATFPKSSWNISCSPQSAVDYTPSNIEGIGGGTMTVLESTRQSVNSSFVRMANQLDLCNIADNALSLGVERGDGQDWQYYPSMILGANNVTPLSMAVAVASLADDGNACEPMSYTKITGSDGSVLTEKSSSCRTVLDQEVARETTSVLQQVVQDNATGFRAQVAGRSVAGKTGTANADTDAWFVGYTPQLATAVWQGHMSEQRSMLNTTINGTFYSEVYGGLFPATVFSSYMTQALANEPVETFTAPTRNVLRGVSSQSSNSALRSNTGTGTQSATSDPSTATDSQDSTAADTAEDPSTNAADASDGSDG